ncbi:extracellular solute-binding protein [Streptomyces griseofuscus]|uniref:Extracellular solute-binding protein n=1 Tax=Streptomyces griseofuscus TaxID=146922 RepID=A0A7H1PWG3_9ACTN|nr:MULTISPECIES: extracellular solute-binding protein [Streptomyces]MYQ95681.1 extracellular solute-binding protein [Streptomyces sp. SID4946]BBC92993.1 sugar transporter [Streptomyces rochei]MBA9048752.1 N,N'-diacetylchitobiose transport system substrate-binding protein [Streptomyces murinus]MBJ7004014.1 extracellular solute-binding protein [Streptomyces sp. CRPSP2-6A1]QNT92393.1 extracellular solute-binding protein [Streptomyces griseofuscus]
MKRKLASAIVIAGMMVSVAACGGNDGNDSKDAGPSSWKGQTLTVWTMDGSAPPQWSKDVQAAFEKKTGAKLKFEIQKWDGIQQKITTALSEDTPPDVLEVGNTQTPAYASTGGLADLGDLKQSIGADWTASVSKSSVYDGKQYAAPWYFANRVVIYNKKIWAKAGINSTPKTRDEFLKDLDTIGKKTDAEPIYLPGQNWYFLDGLIVGQGGDLVKKQGDKYVSNLADPKVAAAMEIYKKYAAYSKAPKDKDEATPQQATVFAKGKTGAFIGMGWEAATAIQANKSIEKDLGYFTIPGATADKPEGVFLGGSNLAVAQNSKKQSLAKEFLKIALSDQYEGELAKLSGVIPNKTSLESNLKGNAAAEAAAPGAAVGGTTPLIPEWAAVENTPNPIKSYMTAVLNGKAPAAAAKDVEGEINQRLAQQN